MAAASGESIITGLIADSYDISSLLTVS